MKNWFFFFKRNKNSNRENNNNFYNFKLSNSTDYGKSYNALTNDFCKNIIEKYKDANIVSIEKDIDGKDFYQINKNNIKNIQIVNKDDFDKCNDFYSDLEKFNEIFKKTNFIKYEYIKNGDTENDINFKYDLNGYFQDNKIKMIIDFFSDKADNLLKTIINSNDNSKESEKKILEAKEKLKNDSSKKISELFNDLDIYAKPIVDIDGSIFKINVKTNEHYSVNDNVETNNNSSGYKSIFWIIFKLEIAIQNSNENNEKWIIIADEPDKNLHTLLQLQLIRYIKNRLKSAPNVFFIYSTHSAFLIDKDIKNLTIIRDKIGITRIKNNDEINNGDLVSYYPEIVKLVIDKSNFLTQVSDKNNIFIDSKSPDNLKNVEQYISEKYGYFLKNIKLNLININSEEDRGEELVTKTLSKIEDFSEYLNNFEKCKYAVILSKELLKKIISENDKKKQ